MMNNMYIIAYLLFYTAFTCGYRELARNMKRPAALTVLVESVAGTLVLLFVPFFELKVPASPWVYLTFLTSCVFYSISDRLNTIVRANMDASSFSVLRQINTVIMIIAGFMIQGEAFSCNKIIGASLIVGSNVLVFYKKGSLKANRYLLLGIASAMSSCTAQLIDINISAQFNLALYISLSLLTPATIIALTGRVRPEDVAEEVKNSSRYILLITGISSSISPLLLLLCYTSGDLTVVAPLCSLTVFLTIMVSYFVLREKDNLKKKLLSGLLIVIGVIIINR